MEDDVQALFRLAEKAMQEAADRVVEEARQTNSSVVVWEDGAVRHIPPDQLPPPKQPSP